jgi:eukaryotic-like serine/threonine-protein kinase
MRTFSRPPSRGRLLYQAKARESVSLAAMLLAEGKIEEADALLAKTPLNSIEPSMEATQVFRALAEWNAIRQRWRQAADCYLLLLQANRLHQGKPPEGGLLVLIAIAPTLVEAGRFPEYAHFREETLARYGNTTDLIDCSILLKACLLRPADKELLVRLKPNADVLKAALERGALDAYQSAFAALSLAMIAYRSGDDHAALEWSRKCLASPDANQARTAAAQSLVALAAHRLSLPDVAKPALEQAEAIFAGPFDRDVYYPRGQGNGHWLDWAIARVLMQEASSVGSDKTR